MAESATPWWATLVAILLTAIVSVLGTYYALRPAPIGAPSVPSAGSFFKDTITYIPHILLLFGVLADMFTQEGVYSIPSLVGLISIPLNFVFKYFWAGLYDLVAKLSDLLATKPENAAVPIIGQKGGVPTNAGRFFKEYDGCTVQGFSALASNYAPQTLVVTATVFSYYMFDLIANRGGSFSAPTAVIFIILFLAEMFIIDDCDVPQEHPAGIAPPGKYLKGLMAFTEGMLFGGSAYSVVQAYYPERLPTAALSPFPRRSRSDLKEVDGKLVDENGLPYIVLPNGQTQPDLSDPDSRGAFAGIAASVTGTGQAAKPEDCPAS